MNDPDKPSHDPVPPGFSAAPQYPSQQQSPPQPEITPFSPAASKDLESEDDVDSLEFGFADKSIRKRFIRKLYATLTVQLSLCGVITAAFLLHTPTNQWVSKHPYLWWIALIILLTTMILMFVCEQIRRKSPMNLIFLGLFTLVQSFLLITVPETEEVLLAILLTIGVCISMTIFAFQSRWHYTIMGVELFLAVIILMMIGAIVKFIFGIIGAFIFCVYMISDTQLMTDDSYTCGLRPDEYIFAALNIYLDIFNIFVYFWNAVRERICPHRYERSFS